VVESGHKPALNTSFQIMRRVTDFGRWNAAELGGDTVTSRRHRAITGGRTIEIRPIFSAHNTNLPRGIDAAGILENNSRSVKRQYGENSSHVSMQ
jgi:hypothetical protein